MARIKELPPLALEQLIIAYPAYRQSLLSKADDCRLSALFELQGHLFTNAAQARGILFHRYAAEVLRTLRRTGEVRIPTEEAMVILREVCAQHDVPPEDVVIVPVRERRILRICALKLASLPFDMRKLIDVERKLEAPIVYDHPQYGKVERTISGTPDALLSDPPDGAVVLDWKTAPSAPADGEGHWKHGDHLHVSYEGYFQQRSYSFVVMANYPSVMRCTLREYYLLPGEARTATIPREGLEHIEHELRDLVIFLDRALMEGSKSKLWAPSPGKHCAYCRRPQACPIEWEARVIEGGISDAKQAERVAAEYVVADQVRKSSREALKGYVDATGMAVPVKSAKGRSELGWGKDSAGRRKFGMHVPDESDRGPADPELDDAFRQAAERAAA